MKYSRQQYMNNEVSHADYYRQFVTPEIKTMVRDRIGVDRLLRSTDEHLNDIPLSNWDALAGRHSGYRQTLNAGDDNSLATQVCVLKQAARMIIEENKANLEG